MKRRSKILLGIGLLAALAAFALSQFSLHAELERQVAARLEAQGLTDVKVSITSVDRSHVLFSHISFRKEKIEVAGEDVNITATSLPIAEVLRGNYTNVAADWAVKKLTVAGIPYALPPLTGSGKFYTQTGNATVTGEMHDEKRTHQGAFTVTPATAILKDVRVLWQDALVSASSVAIALKKPGAIHIPLKLTGLPLPTALSAAVGDKVTATGDLSGAVELIVMPDGKWTLENGRFATEKAGLIQVSPDALPGEGDQMQMVRTALANFHYKNLMMNLGKDKEGNDLIQLNLSGNNPDALGGRDVKLQVNFSGDVIETLQQTILPLADPTELIEKGTP